MLSDFLTDFNTAKSQSNLIPKGTTVKVKMAIKPGGYENWFTKSYTTGSIYLNAEFIVTEGPYAKRKIFQVIGIKSGKASVEGEDTWGESGRSMLRSILESARNIHAHDTSEKAVIARKINSIADFNGLEFTAKVGIEAQKTFAALSFAGGGSLLIFSFSTDFRNRIFGSIQIQNIFIGNIQAGT